MSQYENMIMLKEQNKKVVFFLEVTQPHVLEESLFTVTDARMSDLTKEKLKLKKKKLVRQK
jgi:hypothetical protein